mgnify:CR=1 FL=1
MKRQYIVPKTLIVNLNNQCALMTGSITEELKSGNVKDGDGFVQYGRASRFGYYYDDEFDEE